MTTFEYFLAALGALVLFVLYRTVKVIKWMRNETKKMKDERLNEQHD